MDRMTACRVSEINYALSTEIDLPKIYQKHTKLTVHYAIVEVDCVVKQNSPRTFVTSVKTVLARSRQMKRRSVRSSAIVASSDFLSSISFLNFPKISDKIASFFGGSTLSHLKAAKHLFSTLRCQQYHSYHGYLPCGRQEGQPIAGCAGKRSSNVLHCPAGPSPAGMSGTIEPRLPIDFDRIANAYVKD
jgi:hypothetical protein